MKKFVFTVLILFIIAIAFFIYEAVSYTTVVAKFNDLEPFEKQMNVYFKGFKIGKDYYSLWVVVFFIN